MHSMEKTYALSDKAALRFKLWPALITSCGIFLVWIYEATLFSIASAAIASGFARWRSGYVPHLITLRSDGYIRFESFLKRIEITAEDTHAIIENKYYREIAVLCQSARTAIPLEISNLKNFIVTVKGFNPAITVKIDKLDHLLK